MLGVPGIGGTTVGNGRHGPVKMMAKVGRLEVRWICMGTSAVIYSVVLHMESRIPLGCRALHGFRAFAIGKCDVAPLCNNCGAETAVVAYTCRKRATIAFNASQLRHLFDT